MAFDTYADLQTAIAKWLNRESSQVTDRIPDFITFAENTIFRRLRSRHIEKVRVYPTTSFDNSQGIDLPADFKEVKLLKWNGRALTRRSDQYEASKDPAAAQGEPVYFIRSEPSKITFWRPPDNNAEVELWYFAKQGPISDSVIPELYLDAPELYLFGALVEAKPFLKATDPEDVGLWQAKFDGVLADLQLESDIAEYAGSTVEVSNPYDDTIIRSTAQGGYY